MNSSVLQNRPRCYVKSYTAQDVMANLTSDSCQKGFCSDTHLSGVGVLFLLPYRFIYILEHHH